MSGGSSSLSDTFNFFLEVVDTELVRLPFEGPELLSNSMDRLGERTEWDGTESEDCGR